MTTDKHLKGMREMISYLSAQLEQTSDRRYAVMLEAVTSQYEQLTKPNHDNT